MKRTIDPIYYKDRIEDLLNKAVKNGVKVVLKHNSIGEHYLLFTGFGTTIAIRLEKYIEEVEE